jgi:coenzyme F420-0:L-glutamate ligase/coenzyme F420-1:gamma-L-glutamate ligase
MRAPERLVLSVVPGIGQIAPGDDLGADIIAAMVKAGLEPLEGDVIVVAQKVVSKAQGQYVDLATVQPSARARELGESTDRDPRLVEVILSESVRVVRQHARALVVEHRDGYVAANAGVDRSNVTAASGDDEVVLLLPKDADGTAQALRRQFEDHFRTALGVIISDSFGRPWRRGTVGVALGAAGICALNDMRGQPDLFGRPLRVTEVALADEIASAASLLMGQAGEAQPVVLVSGFAVAEQPVPARALIRPAADDLFR